jgi:hypothetical protein
MVDVASKQQTTALFLSTIVTRTRRHTELTKKLTKLMGNLCCAREQSVQFFVQFFFTQFNLGSMGPFRVYGALKDAREGSCHIFPLELQRALHL